MRVSAPLPPRTIDRRREALSLAWLSLPADQGFQSLCALPDEAKAALFAWCVAQCLKPQLASDSGADPGLEQAGARLRIDAAAHWRPTADNYWSRVTKAHALEAGGEILGDRWRRDHLADKKPALAKALEAAFAGDATALGFDAATARRAAAWLPSGMAFGETPIPVPAGTTSPNPPPAPVPSPVDDGEEALPAFLTADLDPIQAGDDDFCPLGQQAMRQHQADAAGAAGDQNPFAVDVHAGVPFGLCGVVIAWVWRRPIRRRGDSSTGKARAWSLRR